jgi:glycosyltransferase involved in cell wall biosynthesis
MPSPQEVSLAGKTILQIVPELDIGGAEITTLEMSRAIVAAGGRALVVSEGGALESDIRKVGGEVIKLPAASKNPLTMWRNGRRLADIMQSQAVDLIHARSRAPAWSALRAAKLSGRPYLATYHSKVHDRPRAKIFYNSVMTRGALTIANSHFTAARIHDVHGLAKERLRVIPRGCDVDALARDNFSDDERAAKRAQWGVPEKSFVVLCAARLTAWKGQHIVLDALAQSKDTSNAYLVLVGSAQGRDEYVSALQDQAARLGLADRLVFAGHENNMPSAYAAADLAVMASVEAEPFGRTVIEAQAAGLPVIASDAGGFRETVIARPIGHSAAQINEMTGWLAPIGDARGLAACLDDALTMTPQMREQIGANGRRHVEAQYTQTAMCNRTLNVYCELLT